MPVTVYFVSPTHQSLVPAVRSVAPPATLTEVLDVLLAGPTTVELPTRRSPPPSAASVRVRSAAVSGDVATVDFNSAFGQISGTQQVLAVAQVVYTVTSQLGTTLGVQFEIAGTPVPVPTASGAQVSGPVHLLDYVTLAPTTGSGPSGAAAAAAITTTTVAPGTTTHRGAGDHDLDRAPGGSEGPPNRPSAGAGLLPGHPGGPRPEVLEVVEGAGLVQEDVDDEVPVVHEDPGPVLQSFHARR